MFLILAVLASTAAHAPQRLVVQEYAVDAGHSIVAFSVGFAATRIQGRFTETHGTILYDPEAPERSSVSIVIDAKSIDTGWPHRDDHLRTDDFFDVDRFPTLTFQSTSLARTADGWTMTGPLTMHGVTRPVTIPFRFTQPPTRRPESDWMVLNTVSSLRLARKDFGLLGGSRHNSWFDDLRRASVADSVDIDLEIEGWLADAGSQRPKGVNDAIERIRANGVDAHLDRLRTARAGQTDAEFARYFHGGDLIVRGLIADGRAADAVALSRGLVTLFPQLASAYLVHGFALAVSGDRRAAAQQYALARKVFQPPVPDPNEKYKQDDEYWYFDDQLVRTALEWGRVSEAVGLAQAVTDLYPGTARAHVALGLARALAGDAAGARASYARALELDPRETRAIEWQRRLNP
jgi:polyisoprenoid-binding protein YceI